MKKSQTQKLLELLNDNNWHDTPSILSTVYGSDHLGIARIGARVADLKKEGYKIESKPTRQRSIWQYRLLSDKQMQLL